jgi:hypothetical protein
MHPIVDMNGDWGPWHMIFACESFTEGLIPEMFDRMATGGSLSALEQSYFRVFGPRKCI